IFSEPGTLTSISAEGPVRLGAVTRVAVRVTLSIRVDQLAGALERLQKHARQLHVDSLTIQAPESQAPQSNPPLAVQAQIAAWMLRPSVIRRSSTPTDRSTSRPPHRPMYRSRVSSWQAPCGSPTGATLRSSRQRLTKAAGHCTLETSWTAGVCESSTRTGSSS